MAAALWVVVTAALQIGLVTFSLAVAAALTALLRPVTARLTRAGLPAAAAAALGVLLLLGCGAGAALLVYRRATSELADVAVSAAVGVGQVRGWLVSGPLGLDPAQVDGLRDTVSGFVLGLVPSVSAGASMAVRMIGAALFVVFTVFFLLKDGRRMWRWALSWIPGRSRERVDGAGKVAWDSLTGYVRGVLVVASADAALVGVALLVLGVPLWLSLTLLTFLGGFVPLLGALVVGVLTALVTLVTNGPTDALIVVAVVVVVQQIDGNLLSPLILSRAVDLHPLAVLAAVTSGGLLLGIPGAVLAVPVVAIGYQVAAHLTGRTDDPPDTPAPRRPPGSATFRPIKEKSP